MSADKIQCFLPKGLTEKILSQRDKIEGEKRRVTIMFVDMKGFTPLTEKLSEYVDSGAMQAEYVAVESEHSALAVCIGASSTGARAFTATSANGLLYMSEQVHWTAGARLPMVMCVVNRGVGAPWSVWNDHQDSISQRDAGWIQIYAKDHQEIIDTVIKAYRLTEEVCIPVMVSIPSFSFSSAAVVSAFSFWREPMMI